MIKLIATDMDGTLLNDEGQIDDGFDEVFKELIKREIKFSVASGRQYYRLKEDFKKYFHDTIFIADNGSMVMYRGEKIYSQAMSDRDVRDIIKCAKGDFHLVLSGKKKAYLDTRKKEIIDEIEKYYKEYKIVDDLGTIDDEILKIAVYALGNAEKTYREKLYPKFKDRLTVSLSSEVWIDIYSKKTDKGLAIKKIQEKFNISKDETMAFGDYFNDVEMLNEAKYSYAMENATDDFKKHANFIAGSNNDNGVTRAIRKVVLGKNNEI